MKMQKIAFSLVGGAAAAVALVGAMSMIDSRRAAATPQYAGQTGLPCAQCHQKPDASDGKLNSFGEKFQANGHKLPN